MILYDHILYNKMCVCVIVLAQVCVRASCAQMEIELLPPVLLRR